MNPINFLQEVRSELLRVVWPTRDQIIRLTLQVIVISVIISGIIGILDYSFTTLIQYVIK